LIIFNDVNQLKASQSLCPLKMATGFPCPSCGITKSIVSFYQGNLIESFQYHILGPIVVVFCLFIIPLLIFEILSKRNFLNNILYNRKLAYALAIFLIIYHSIRLYLFIHSNSIDEILKQSIWK